MDGCDARDPKALWTDMAEKQAGGGEKSLKWCFSVFCDCWGFALLIQTYCREEEWDQRPWHALLERLDHWHNLSPEASVFAGKQIDTAATIVYPGYKTSVSRFKHFCCPFSIVLVR